MENKLVMLYNTLGLISTKGEDTVRMADCLKFLGEMIKEVGENKASEDVDAVENKEA